MATKKITFDPTAGVPVASNLTIYGGSNFDTTFTVVDVGNAPYGFTTAWSVSALSVDGWLPLLHSLIFLQH